jgi:hypothetical protein
MLRVETKWQMNPRYMEAQRHLNEKIRSTLVDWLIQVFYNFKLLPETLFLTVNIIDRFFCVNQVAKREVQLVGFSAMLIATKYEEIYPPLLQDYVHYSDGLYTAEQILDMEKAILFDLDFDIQLTSSYRFLERFSKIAKLDSVTFSLSHYMLELGLFDSKMNQYLPSLQAVAAIYTAKKYLKFYNNSFPEEVTDGLSEFGLADHFSSDEVKSCARCFNELAKLI